MEQFDSPEFQRQLRESRLELDRIIARDTKRRARIENAIIIISAAGFLCSIIALIGKLFLR